MSQRDSTPSRTLPIPFWEFVGLCAMMVALSALSIDIMLPGLPEIGEHFALPDPNDRQTVVTSYMLGFAIGQLAAGPVSDRFGRKPVLVAGIAVFLAATAMAIVSARYELLLAARFVQGLGGAAPRVVSVAIVRDLFAGRQMARVMSFVMMVFIMVPVFAPALGGLVLLYGDWTWMFGVLLITGAMVMAWSHLRLPETRPPHDRLELTFDGQRTAWLQLLTTPVTMVYAIAIALMFGCLMAYIASAQQIFVDTYGIGALFPLAFGAVALAAAVAGFVNAQLVGRFGMRRLSHMAVAGYALVSITLVAAEIAMGTDVVGFSLAVGACFFLFGLTVPNFNALAMEPHGKIAGTASSFLGFFTTAIGAVIGWAVGQVYDGTSLPLAAGFALLSVCALGVVRLGDRHQPGPITP